MIVQIYEIQTPQEAEKCIDLGVDHIGSVILSQDEWRIKTLREVTHITERTDIKNSIIPLFQDRDTVYRALDYYRPDYMHLCESLTDNDGKEIGLDRFFQFQADMKEKFPEIGIIRSIPIPEEGSSSDFPALKIARSLEPVTDIFLTDTFLKEAPVQGYIGITGKKVDREIARELVLKSKKPVILAGGLSPENIYDALTKIKPAGGDSCTHTNIVDEEGKPIRFKKDFLKVKEFVMEVRRAEEQN